MKRLREKESFREGIARVAVPIDRLNDTSIAKAILVMAADDGALVVPTLKPGHIAIVVAEETRRKMVVFASNADMVAFAEKYGLKMVSPQELS